MGLTVFNPLARMSRWVVSVWKDKLRRNDLIARTVRDQHVVSYNLGSPAEGFACFRESLCARG